MVTTLYCFLEVNRGMISERGQIGWEILQVV